MDPLLAMKDLVLKMEPSAQGISDADFLRFLRARDGDEVNAAKFMVQHLKWRRSYLPKGFIDEREIETELNRKQIFMQGHDRHGCPIIVMLTSRHRAYERDLDEIKRLFVYAFDKAASSNKGDEGKFIIIGDLKDWGLTNMDIQGYLAVLDILQNQYPERLRKLYLVHLPYLFWGAWKIVSPLIDKNTRKKVVLVEDSNVEKLLLEDMDKDQIPDIYGGNTELVPIQDSLRPVIG